MKITRQQTKVIIELTYEEAEAMKRIMQKIAIETGCDLALYYYLDELFGEPNE